MPKEIKIIFLFSSCVKEQSEHRNIKFGFCDRSQSHYKKCWNFIDNVSHRGVVTSRVRDYLIFYQWYQVFSRLSNFNTVMSGMIFPMWKMHFVILKTVTLTYIESVINNGGWWLKYQTFWVGDSYGLKQVIVAMAGWWRVLYSVLGI